jgi:hypothetical protein
LIRRLRLRALLVSAFVLAGGFAAAADQRPMIDPDVRAEVARGPVRVLVDLQVTGGTQAEIASAQQTVIARLAGTRFTRGRQYGSVPMMALEIGADALAALENMGDLVRRVRADVPRATQGGA